ncbi:hypothetical protein HOY82DRAFT_607674 [Tuber indicum]|nr:hypothetical protein HOY82DRAFT_607674 [Tuber indicum]
MKAASVSYSPAVAVELVAVVTLQVAEVVALPTAGMCVESSLLWDSAFALTASVEASAASPPPSGAIVSSLASSPDGVRIESPPPRDAAVPPAVPSMLVVSPTSCVPGLCFSYCSFVLG